MTAIDKLGKIFNRQILIWLAALAGGAILGLLNIGWIDDLSSFVSTVFTRVFQLLAVPTIALAVMCTLSAFGKQKSTGKIFAHAIGYTLATTLSAALVGIILYVVIAPANLPSTLIDGGNAEVPTDLNTTSYYDHILNVIPNNLVRPILEGNVLSILLIAVGAGLALAHMEESKEKRQVVDFIEGLQQLLFLALKAVITVLPIGIVAFAERLTAEMSGGVIADSLGKYVLVIMGGNILQMVIVLPLFLIAKGLNPIKVAKAMAPAILVALFTKSSAATLPTTLSSAENRLKISPRVSRFVLPICTTINMNGCAAFIAVTSLFVMQNSGFFSIDSPITDLLPTLLVWLLVSVVSAVGNAGVPMGCYFLTLSLMTGTGAAVGVMGIILPIYTIIDMVETAENVWSDSCVCAIVNDNGAYDEGNWVI